MSNTGLEELPRLLEGHRLAGFPEAPPWQESRPPWAVDILEVQQPHLLNWLASFFAVSNDPQAVNVPLPPKLCFVAVGPAINITLKGGEAQFSFEPRASVPVSSLKQLVEVLSFWRRQPTTIEVRRDDGEVHYVKARCWNRPEFVHLATTKITWSRDPELHPYDLARGRRGRAADAVRFGIIPIDIDTVDGHHAPRSDGLRLPERHEIPQLLAASSLPWGSIIDSAGGCYAYLRLEHALDFQEDGDRCKGLLLAAQQSVIEPARARGIHVDLAFTSGTALCRVPFTRQLKYLWRGQPPAPLKCPDLSNQPAVQLGSLEALPKPKPHSRSARKSVAHKQRVARLGADMPTALSDHLEVRAKETPGGRILVLRTCPMCKADGDKAHISEDSWQLRCKRSSCRGSHGVGYEQWLAELPRSARSTIRKHIQNDRAWQRIDEFTPLSHRDEMAVWVRDHKEGAAEVQRQLTRHHLLGGGKHADSGANNRMLIIDGDCGVGKTMGAARASVMMPLTYSAHQYTHLDVFPAPDTYQIQGQQKGCMIVGLGEAASPRGVNRPYLCFHHRDPCPHLGKCLAQPRIETNKTPTCVHAALPTLNFGAVVEDGRILPTGERGKDISPNSLLVIDEAPGIWRDSKCTAEDLENSVRLQNSFYYRNESLVRGGDYSEGEDALVRLLVLRSIVDRLSEQMRLESARQHAEYATTWNADRVATVIQEVAGSLDCTPGFGDWRLLFRLCMVTDRTAPSGKRSCIPAKYDWTGFEQRPDRRTKLHVESIVPQCVVDACRAVAAVLEGESGWRMKLAATLAGHHASLVVLNLQSLTLSGSTGTAILSASAPLYSRLLASVFPGRERCFVRIALCQHSSTRRVLLATMSLGRAHAVRAFGDTSGGSGGGSAKSSYLGSLARALQEAASRVALMAQEGLMPSGPQRTLLVGFEPVVSWLTSSDEGKQWLSDHVPPELLVVPGNPHGSEQSEWGTIVYWGGRGKGENCWADCRVVVTAGDNIPNLGDVEARWGDVVDLETGEYFDAQELAIWMAQESAMQALERSRPGREGLATVLLHAGGYLPMGFSTDDEVIIAEETRGAARAAKSKAAVLETIRSLCDQGTGAVRASAESVSEATGLSLNTVYARLDEMMPEELIAAFGESASSSDSLYKYIALGQAAKLAPVVEGFIPRLQVALRGGSSLPKAQTAMRLLAELDPSTEPPSERTLRNHLKVIHRALGGKEASLIAKRRDTLRIRLLALMAVLAHVRLLEEFLARAMEALLPRDADDEAIPIQSIGESVKRPSLSGNDVEPGRSEEVA